MDQNTGCTTPGWLLARSTPFPVAVHIKDLPNSWIDSLSKLLFDLGLSREGEHFKFNLCVFICIELYSFSKAQTLKTVKTGSDSGTYSSYNSFLFNLASNLTSDALQPNSDGLHPSSHGLQPKSSLFLA